nr:MAG TPA: hypothetical protein [Caudoviricetes sp.]
MSVGNPFTDHPSWTGRVRLKKSPMRHKAPGRWKDGSHRGPQCLESCVEIRR